MWTIDEALLDATLRADSRLLLALLAAASAERLMTLADELACFLSTPALVALAYADDEMADAPCLADADAEL